MIQIDRLPAFNDNYLWGLYEGQSAWVVDPGDAEVVQTWLTQKNLVLNGILLTHHHNDHTGGVEALVEKNPMVKVIGSKQALRGVSAPVSDGDTIDLLSRRFRVMEVPGHTLDHVAFFSADPSPILFCGDTVFWAVAGACSKEPPSNFNRAWPGLLSYLPKPCSIARTNTHKPTWNLPAGCYRTTRPLQNGSRTLYLYEKTTSRPFLTRWRGNCTAIPFFASTTQAL